MGVSTPLVIDLSHWNPTPDWATLAKSGGIGVFFKATEGTSYVDDTLFARAKAAKQAGLLTATYHFMRGTDIARQIDHYLDTIDPVEGERVALDHEDTGTSLAELEQAVDHLLGLRPDLQVTIYSGHLIKEQLGSKRSAILAEKTSLWIAQYTSASAPTWPTATWPIWSLWQFTDKATVPGISAPVDGNRWNGDEASLRAWMSPVGAEPVPLPEPEVAAMSVVLAISQPGVPRPASIKVDVTWNGEIVA